MEDYEIVIQSKAEVVTRGELRRRFYRAHYTEEAFWDRPTKRTVVRPVALVKMPGKRDEKVAIYTHDYYVRITKGASVLRGPHSAKLFLRVNGEEVWVASCQLSGSWFEIKRLRRSLRLAIRRREYYASPSALEEEIEISEPEAESPDITIFSTQRRRKKSDKYRRGCVYLKEGDPLKCPRCGKTRRTLSALAKHIRIKHKRLLCISHPVRNWNLYPLTGLQSREQAAAVKRLQYPSRRATKRDLKSFKMWPPKVWKGKKYGKKPSRSHRIRS